MGGPGGDGRGRDSRDGRLAVAGPGGPGVGMGIGGGRGGFGGGPGGWRPAAVRAVLRWAADPEWEAAAGDAAAGLAGACRMPWRSGTVGAIRAHVQRQRDRSVWITPYGMRARYSVTGASCRQARLREWPRGHHVRRAAADSQAGERQQAHHVHVRLSGRSATARARSREPVNMPTALERIGDFSQTYGARRAGRSSTTPLTGLALPRQHDSGQPHQRDVDGAAESTSRIPICRLPRAIIRRPGAAEQFPEHQLPAVEHPDRKEGHGSTSASAIRAAAAYRPICSSSSTPAPAAESTPTWRGRATFTTRVINNLRYTFSRSRQLSSPYFAEPRERGGGPRTSPALRRIRRTGGRPI